MISVVTPVRNEGRRIAATIRSAARARTGTTELEFVVADDASDDGCTDDLDRVARTLPGVRLVVVRSDEHVGIPRARNLGLKAATGDVIFMTDAHVRFSSGWDEHVLEHIRPQRILATTISNGKSWSATGCVLAVPFMGTYWNKDAPGPLQPVQVAACPGTALSRKLYERIGGYDEGMLLYAAAEPEFSVRAWLSGARIVALPQVTITHRFKTDREVQERTTKLRPYMVHNAVRFAICYLDEPLVLQTMRQHSILFREQALEGLRMVATSDVYERRQQLRTSLPHDFDWFVRKFKLKDQAGRPIPTAPVV